MKQIKSINEIGNELILLFIYGENCGWCKKVQPVVEEFERRHPEVKILKILREDMKMERGTPTFFFYENGKAYNRFTSGNTTLSDFERALNEKSKGIIQTNNFEEVKKSIKQSILYLIKDNCQVCEQMKPIIEKYAQDNPTKQVFQMNSSAEIKAKLGINETINLPFIAVISRGVVATTFSQGLKSYEEIKSFVENAKGHVSGNCGDSSKSIFPITPDKRDEEIKFLREQVVLLTNIINRLTLK